jgi:hypothetical protein
MNLLIRIFAMTVLFCCLLPLAVADPTETDTRQGIAPDIREDEIKLKVQRGDFVVVPIPISNPTLGSGLVAGAAYFYPQTEEQKKAQPASVTMLGGMYTSNDSRAAVIAQQNYWKDDNWRFTGVAGGADLRLTLVAPEVDGSAQRVDWRVNGYFASARLSRKLAGNWYGGFFARYVDAEQSIVPDTFDAEFDASSDIRSAGLGLMTEYDSRDMPINSYDGQHFNFQALFNDEAIGSTRTYQSFDAYFRLYHELADSLVLAFDFQACKRNGDVPLWDACMIKLRGFSATDYMGRSSISGQVEARWRLNDRWGLVGFGGFGEQTRTFTGYRDGQTIPSYGVGVRFMVLQSKRVNLRVDFARSRDDNAVHISVGEAF